MNDPIPNQFWTLYDKVQGAIIREHEPTPGTATEELPTGLDQNLAWLVESSDPQPTFDANIERLEPMDVITIDPANNATGTRVFSWSKVPLSDAQLDDKEVQAKRKTKKASVIAAAEKLRNEENIKDADVYVLLQEYVLESRKDLTE